MAYDRRRYRLRQFLDGAPSKKSMWIRVAFYSAVLLAVLLFQDNLGESAAGCFRAFGSSQ